MGSVQHRIHALFCVSCGRAADCVVAVARARRDEDAVGFLAIQGDWCPDGAGEVVVVVCIWAIEATGRCLGKVVASTGLVVDDGNEACAYC